MAVTLNDNITRIENAKAAIVSSIVAKGVTVPASTKIENLPAKIDEIQTGAEPKLIKLWCDHNGNYQPSSDIDGFSEVEVNVPSTSGIDLSGTGWDGPMNTFFPVKDGLRHFLPDNIDKMRQDYQKWEEKADKTSAAYFYANDKLMIYAPGIFTNQVVNAQSMFSGCDGLVAIPYFEFPNLTNSTDMFKGCKNLVYVESPVNLPALEYGNMFSNCGIVTSPYIIAPELKKCSFFSGCTKLKYVMPFDTSMATSFDYMFNGCSVLEAVPYFDTSKGTDFSEMFNNCENITEIPQLNTSSGLTFRDMFNCCRSLKSVPQLDTSKGTDFFSMFHNCEALTTIPEMDTSNGEDFSYMFFSCPKLTTLPVLNLGKATNVTSMFTSCLALTTLGGFTDLKISIDLLDSPNLTKQSCLNIFNTIATVTDGQTIKFHPTVKARLNPQDIKIATDKGWTIQ